MMVLPIVYLYFCPLYNETFAHLLLIDSSKP
jgi:hypothetical protein